MSKYRRIKYEDRCQIYALSKRGSSQESIAEVLGVSQSAVSRENAVKMATGNGSFSTQTDMLVVRQSISQSSFANICCGSSIARTFWISLGFGASTTFASLQSHRK
jgi:hypothetical protein